MCYLIADHEHRELVAVFDSKDLPVEFVDFLEARAFGHGEDQEEAFT
mgnify:FL=1